MQVRKFQPEQDLQSLEAYLAEQYLTNHNTTSWLPERLHDLIYRMGAQEDVKSMDYMYLWEEQGSIVACVLPDGENIYMSIKSGFEHLFRSMLAHSEQHCLPLFGKAADGSVKFWVAVSAGLPYMHEELRAAGYTRYADEEYENCIDPQKACVRVDLAPGFRLLYGEEYPNEENKWNALHFGFHPDHEGIGYRTDMAPYHARKNSSLYPDSFECIVVDPNAREENDVCAYAFVYVDKRTKTALIEPVSTREKYRRKGLATAMLHGAVLRCKELGIEKCYVNSFGSWRRDFYNAAGFATEDSVVFWHKVLTPGA